jgi:hypothetical protein
MLRFASQREILDTIERGCSIIDIVETTGHDNAADVRTHRYNL